MADPELSLSIWSSGLTALAPATKILSQRTWPHDSVRLRAQARTFDYQAGDVGYVPLAMGHYVQNVGDDTLRFLELFRSSEFADLSLNQWLALSPRAKVKATLNVDDKTLDALKKAEPVIVK